MKGSKKRAPTSGTQNMSIDLGKKFGRNGRNVDGEVDAGEKSKSTGFKTRLFNKDAPPSPSKTIREMEESIKRLLQENTSSLTSLHGTVEEAAEAAAYSSKLQREPDLLFSPTDPDLGADGLEGLEGFAYHWQGLSTSPRNSMNGGGSSGFSGVGERTARIADLRDRDKSKIAKLIQELVKYGQENERLSKTLREKEVEHRSIVEKLKGENQVLETKYGETRRKFAQCLTMLKTYQEKLSEFEQAFEERERQDAIAADEEIQQLKDQVLRLQTLILERTKRDDEEKRPSSPPTVEKQLVTRKPPNSEETRTRRFEQKLKEHESIKLELKREFGNNDDTESLSSTEDEREKHDHNENAVALGMEDLRSNEATAEDEDKLANNLDDLLLRRSSSRNHRESKFAMKIHGNDDDTVLENFLTEQRAWRSKQQKQHDQHHNSLSSSYRAKWSEEEDSMFFSTTTNPNNNRPQKPDPSTIRTGPSLIDPDNFENSQFDSSLFDIVDQLEART